MPNTNLSIHGENFFINDRLVYSEIEGSNEHAHGLLMNARFIQGIFDDRSGRERYARWGRDAFDPSQNTRELIDALPQWYEYGLRAFTVGFQGGGPCFTINSDTIDNNPFGEDGTLLDSAYAERMDSLIRAADELGMVVIVSYFYGRQARRIRGGRAIRNAVVTASRFLREGGYTNVIIEVANEQDGGHFREHPIIMSEDGMAVLIDLARKESGGLPVGCSGNGNSAYHEICLASDVLLIHGNHCTRQDFNNLICRVREWAPGKPVVCNEDSQSIGQLEVAFKNHCSWGYYNNMTKQEPPAYWGVLPGEDKYFATRMALGIGIAVQDISLEDQYYIQGLEREMTLGGDRWVRLASLWPESINYVDFFHNGKLLCTSYDEPFSINFISNWQQGPVNNCSDDDEWRAEIHLRNGDTIEKQAVPAELSVLQTV